MPEYLAPGVFVEEVSFRPQSIEGVATSTTAFVGPSRGGPVRIDDAPLITSFSEFERIYGGLDRLDFTDTAFESDNHLAHAVRAYFEEGGRRLYVVRAYNPEFDESVPRDEPGFAAGSWTNANFASGRWDDGIARWPDTGVTPAAQFALRARNPGEAANVPVRFRFRLGQNILDTGASPTVVQGAAAFDTVVARSIGSPAFSVAYWVEDYFDTALQIEAQRLRDATGAIVTLDQVADVRILTVTIEMSPMGRFNDELVWENLALDPRARSSISQRLAADPSRRSIRLYNAMVFHTELTNGAAIADAMLGQQSLAGPGNTVGGGLLGTERERTFQIELTGGSDGQRPTATQYVGDDGDAQGRKSGIRALEDLEDVSIVAAPGSTFGYFDGYQTNADAIIRLLISHCERMRYRVAVLDPGDGMTLTGVRELRASLDSTRAALYYPWVRGFDPVTETEITLPPSGYIAGIYARNDIERGVHKAPANEVVRLALGFEIPINTAQQEVLNPEGINCLRFFEGRGYRVWGARTISSNSEWRYVNVRRYFAYVERSIELGTQFAVFEPNGPVLWSNVQRAVSDFLFNEWSEGRLFGTKPEEAFFVRCDRTTMTQNDIDNGRLICVVGISPLRPAEFVIFRIGQWTADASI